MRIACIHLPQLSLQCVTRIEPSLRSGALVVVGHGDGRSVLTAPIVVSCSRAAWALGVRLGMTATAARAASPEVRVVHADPALEKETIRAIADALLAASPVVDLGGRIGAGGAHLAMYAEVPAKTRGAAFGERVHALIGQLGLTARIGIADDRFTAWVAATTGDDQHAVVSVPRGGSAAFLAPRPLSLLAIAPEVQHVLESLGVSTLGEFASLPAPSVARPIERDYQALARGESGTTLRAYTPDAPIREEIAIAPSLGGLAAIEQLAERVALRLAGRGRFAAKLDAVTIGADGDRTWPIEPPKPIAGESELAQALGHLASVAAAGSWRLRVVVAAEASSIPEEVVAAVAPDDRGVSIDALAVVLANTGTGDLFGDMSAADRRDASHRRFRRTRRGKHRERVATSVAGVQPRLFEK